MLTDWCPMGALHDRLEFLSDELLDQLPRQEELGGLNFSIAAETLRRIRTVARAYDEQAPTEVPEEVSRGASDHLQALEQLVAEIQSFNLQVADSANVHAGIMTRLAATREWFLTHVRPQVQGSFVDVAAKQVELNALLEGVRRSASETEDLLARVRQLAGEAGAGQLSGYYGTQADGHESAAMRFFAGAVAATVALAIGAAFLFGSLEVDTEASTGAQWVELARNALVRLFFLGLGAFVVNFLIRGYRTNKHLQVVNEQKRNALDTYGLFVEAVEAREAQDVITLELVRVVFATAESGFLSDSGEQTVVESPTSMLSLLLAKQTSAP